MATGNKRIASLVVILGWLFVPASAGAQAPAAGTIAGVVRDASGGVLPGVSVEAASPALIEQVRVALTDGRGNYKIVNLRPGTYTVTVTLPGFATVIREGLELTTGFTATVNAEMTVGGVEESITVSGASPVVDVQNSRTQAVLSSELLDSIPNAKTVASFTALTLGVTASSPNKQDVGGNQAEAVISMSYHGSRGNDSKLLIEGMSTHNNSGAGGVGRVYFVNLAATEEVTLETTGMTAESQTSGIQVNYVPKDGGNTFSAYFAGSYANDSHQSSNLTPALQSRGVNSISKSKKVYDRGIAFGGPIVKNKLWFYTAHRGWGVQNFQPNAFFNLTPNTLTYTPDPSRPVFQENIAKDHSVRLTFQAGQKNKFAFTDSLQRNCFCFFRAGSTRAPEAANSLFYEPHHTMGTWTYAASNRLLIEAGVRRAYQPRLSVPPEGAVVGPDSIAIDDVGTGVSFGAYYNRRVGGTSYSAKGLESNQLTARATLSYITGSHSFKAGYFTYIGYNYADYTINNDLAYRFQNGTPIRITQFATPLLTELRNTDFGVFAQDQWTIDRMTINMGLRFDYFNGHVEEANLPAKRFVPATSFARIDNVPNWRDISPRVGVAYDLFGNGRTALKGSFGKYMQGEGVTGVTQANNPQATVVLAADRTWGDTNGDFVPDCDLTNIAANGECGALNNDAFGQVRTPNTTFGKDVLEGWGVRPYNVRTSVTLQHQLRPGMALNISWFRNAFHNFSVSDNLLVEPGDFDPFCVTAPTHSSLPSGGGNELCGFYDINPAKFGQVTNLITQASNFGDQTQVYNGVEVGVNARLVGGGVLSGGVSSGRTVTDNCFVVDSPQQERFCHVAPPWSSGTQVKFHVVYPLPWGIQTSAVFQNLPAIPVEANNTFSNAAIAPSLGRNLSAGANGRVKAALYQPLSQFEADRISQFDLRISKRFDVGGLQLEGQFDIYNAFNSNSILAVNTTYGGSWTRPTAIMGPRMFKFGTVIRF